MTQFLIFLTNHSFFEQFSYSLFRSQKTSNLITKIWLKSYFWYFFCKFFFQTSDLLIFSVLMRDVSKSHWLLTKNGQCEQIAQVAHQKWAICSVCSPKMSEWANRLFLFERIPSFFECIAHLLTICSFFWKKTRDLLRKPMSEFPTLAKDGNRLFMIIVLKNKECIRKV